MSLNLCYPNTFKEPAGTYRFRIMISHNFFELGGFETSEQAAWECDKVRLWAIDQNLCGRRVAYTFPERIKSISSSEYETRHPKVSEFLTALAAMKRPSPEVQEPVFSPELTQNHNDSLWRLVDACQKFPNQIHPSFAEGFLTPKNRRSLSSAIRLAEKLSDVLNSLKK